MRKLLIYSIYLMLVKGSTILNILPNTKHCNQVSFSCVVNPHESTIKILLPDKTKAVECTAPLGDEIACSPQILYSSNVTEHKNATTVVISILSPNKTIHNGNWSCVHGPNSPEQEKSFGILTVNYGPINTILNSTSLSYNINESHQLESIHCSADCNPVCEFIWKGPGSFMVNGPNLKIDSVKRSNTGDYICTASNCIGSVNSANLSIHVLYGPQYVSLQPPNSTYNVIEENTLEPIYCFADCKPNCSYNWKGPGLFIFSTQILQIFNISRSQSGTYTCTANNSLGSKHSQNIVVNVNYVANITRMIITGNNFTIKEHSQHVVICEAGGFPLPQITLRYSKNNTIMVQTTGARLNFTIKYARCEDTGQYACEATNKYTQRIAIIKELYVLCAPRRIDRTIQLSTGNILNVSTMYFAYPKPDFNWFFRNSEFHNKTKLVNDKHGVQISNVFGIDAEVYRHRSNMIRYSFQEKDFGTYIITARNELNDSTDYFNILVKAETKNEVLAAAIGGAFSFAAFIILVILVLLFILRRFKHHPSTKARSTNVNGGSGIAEENNGNVEDEMRINELYVSADIINDMSVSNNGAVGGEDISKYSEGENRRKKKSSPSDTCTVYSKVQKQNTENNAEPIAKPYDPSTIYAVVNKPKNQETARNTNVNDGSRIAGETNDNSEDEMRINELYVSADIINDMSVSNNGAVGREDILKYSERENRRKKKSSPSDTCTVYSIVQKQNTENNAEPIAKPYDPSTMNAVVNKPKYPETVYKKNEDWKIKKISRRNKKARATSGKQDKDGLAYADLELKEPKTDGNILVIHGKKHKTNYAEVDLTKKADPRPTNDAIEDTMNL